MSHPFRSESHADVAIGPEPPGWAVWDLVGPDLSGRCHTTVSGWATLPDAELALGVIQLLPTHVWGQSSLEANKGVLLNIENDASPTEVDGDHLRDGMMAMIRVEVHYSQVRAPRTSCATCGDYEAPC